MRIKSIYGGNMREDNLAKLNAVVAAAEGIKHKVHALCSNYDMIPHSYNTYEAIDFIHRFLGITKEDAEEHYRRWRKHYVGA